MKVLLSIKPEYAEKIFSGEKKYEFRKIGFKNRFIRTVVVYATMPVGKIIGEFGIKQILKDNPEQIWQKTKKYSGIKDLLTQRKNLKISLHHNHLGIYSKRTKEKIT